ncbi:MAG: hypothetical protein H0U44_10735 [Flavisolibacter sp.]|jgi:hypothetical protein|nr:hypothetical protein [Flavisolibacter sp.]
MLPAAIIHPQDRFNEYKIVIEPSEKIISMLNKELPAELFGFRQPQPEIMLGAFYAKEGMEPTISRWMERICNLQGGFELRLNNFGGKPPGKIYIHVQDPFPLRQIINQMRMIDPFIQSSGCPAFWFNPAPALELFQLPSTVFSSALDILTDLDFNESFKAGVAKLYKRKGDRFDLLDSFILPDNKLY